MTSFLTQVYGTPVSPKNLILDSTHTLRVDKKGDFFLIDTSHRSTWKGRIISFIQWIIYGSKEKASDKAISQAIDQFKATLLKTSRQAENLIGKIDQASKTISSFKVDADYSHNAQITTKIDNFRIEILTYFADKGCVEAQLELGYCYEFGIDVRKNEKMAFNRYFEAAEQNNMYGIYNVGICFLDGISVDKDTNKAFNFIYLAAENGLECAQNTLGLMHQEDKKNEQKALEYFKLGAEKGYSPSLNNLGRCYDYGFGVEQNRKMAFQHYLRAAKLENAAAQYNVGNCYQNGIGTDVDNQKAFEWYQKAAINNYPLALNNLGYCYDFGIGVKKNRRLAFKNYNKAASFGLAEARYNVGNCYYNGHGVKKNRKKAKELLTLAKQVLNSI